MADRIHGRGHGRNEAFRTLMPWQLHFGLRNKSILTERYPGRLTRALLVLCGSMPRTSELRDFSAAELFGAVSHQQNRAKNPDGYPSPFQTIR